MGPGRSRNRFELAFVASMWAGLLVAGCSREEDMKADADVASFAPMPDINAPAPKALPGAAAERKAAADDPLAGMTLPGKSTLDTRFGANEVEKQLRIAMRTARDGQPEKAAQLLDQILAVEPINREALLGRSAIAFDESLKEKTPEARLAAVEKAVKFARALRRAYDEPKPHENQFFARIIYGYAQALAQTGRFDDAIKTLDEASEAGFEAYFAVEIDEKMGELRKAPQFAAALKAHDAARLTAARDRVKDAIAKPVDLPFKFTLRDLENKPVSLTDFKGKVVLVDYWGTWCAPCRQAIPQLVELYRNRHGKGLEIVGLAYEKDIPDESKAREAVKAFAKQALITYPCLMGDEATIVQIPEFKGFPTSVIVDRAGQVRLVIRENNTQTLDTIRDVVEVLLEEPVPPATAPAAKPKAEPTKKASTK